MTPRATPLATTLPPSYAERLARAAEIGDHLGIDSITDELAQHYPELVRPRGDMGLFPSVAAERANPWRGAA